MTTLSERTVMAVEREKKEKRGEKVNDYSGTIVSERRRWRTHTLGPKEKTRGEKVNDYSGTIV